MATAATSCVSVLRLNDLHPRFSSLLPKVVSEDGQPCPDGRSWRASGQHSTQGELALEQAYGRLYPTAEPPKLFKPPLVLMSSLSLTQTTDLRDAHFLDTDPFKLLHIVGAVEPSVGGHLTGHNPQTPFCLSHQRKELRLITGIALFDVIVNDQPRAILHQLKGATKLYRFVEFSLADSPGLRIIEGNNAPRRLCLTNPACPKSHSPNFQAWSRS